jgi:wyosine [tRNA(Phe)-imidazoG37] synthetase (radical SAM superfamily)
MFLPLLFKEKNMYKYLFGPVPSRRLGISLGVDLVPKKVCSLDCVYCEVGKTTKLSTDRKEYILYDNVVKELEHYFTNNPNPDFITFSGAGEPTLNSRIGDVLRYIKKNKADIPVAVLTNGTLLYDKNVRKELLDTDIVLPSLDAATAISFNKINRPAKDLDINKIVQGLIDFRKEFKGKIWLEVFILPGYNDNNTELLELKKVITKIAPDSIQLNTLDRPGTVENLRSSSRSELQKIVDLWGFDNVEIISSTKHRKSIKSYREDIESTILETISRRPCTVDDLVQILGVHINEINKYLDVLEADNKIETVKQKRGLFYQQKQDS